MPKDGLLRTAYTEHREATHVQTTEEVRINSKTIVTRKIQFTDTKKYEQCSDCSSEDEKLSGKTCICEPGKDDFYQETMSKQPRDRMLSGSRIQSNQRTEFCRVEKHHRQIGI